MHVPPGFSIVTPYVFVNGAEAYLTFLKQALGGRERGRSLRPDGKIANAQIAFGTSTVMISEAQAEFPASRTAFYLYVEDAGRALERAIASGAELVMKVADMPYGDRQGGVRDIAGNIWWVSQRLTAEPYFKADKL
jgi:PhnB protein